MRRTHFTLTLAVLALALVPAVATAKEEPGPPPPTLTTETFFDANPSIEGACNPDGTGTITFTTSGTAGGPYSGPYTATGTATLSDQPDIGAFRLASFTETFTINSPVGKVTGTKRLSPGETTSVGFCGERDGDSVLLALANLDALRYTAEITTPDGRRFTDQGRTDVRVRRTLFASGFELVNFSEQFLSNFPTAQPVCDNFKDKPGEDKDKCKDKP